MNKREITIDYDEYKTYRVNDTDTLDYIMIYLTNLRRRDKKTFCKLIKEIRQLADNE